MLTDLHTFAAQISNADAELAHGLLSAVASGHPGGVPLARAAGVTAATFADEDLRALWVALEDAAARGLDRTAAAKSCRALLRSMGWWDAGGPYGGYGCRWSDERLAELFTSHPSPAAVPALAREFVDLSARWRRVRRLAGLLERAIRHAGDALHPRHSGTPPQERAA